MSKQVRNIAIISVVFVLLIGAIIALVFVKEKEPAGASSAVSSTPAISLIAKDKTLFTSLDVKNEKGSFTIVPNSADLIIKGKETLKFNQTSLSGIRDGLSALNADVLIEENPADLAKYGLDKPKAQAEIKYSDNSSFTLLIGNKAPNGSAYYVKLADNKVYLVSASNVDSLFSNPAEFLDTAILTTIDQQKAVEMDNIIVSGKARTDTVKLMKNAESTSSAAVAMSTHRMVLPYEYDVNLDKLGAFFTGIIAIAPEAGISLDATANGLKTYGLDKPDYKLSYTFEGKNINLSFNKIDESSYALYKDDVAAIFKVSATSLAVLSIKADDLASRMPALIGIDTVSSLTIEANGKTYVYNLTGEGDTQKVSYNGNEVDLDSFRTLYQGFIGLQTEGRAETTKTAGANILKYTFKFKDMAKKDLVIELPPIDGRRCLYIQNGKGVFYTLKTEVDKVIAQLNTYVSTGKLAS